MVPVAGDRLSQLNFFPAVWLQGLKMVDWLWVAGFGLKLPPPERCLGLILRVERGHGGWKITKSRPVSGGE